MAYSHLFAAKSALVLLLTSEIYAGRIFDAVISSVQDVFTESGRNFTLSCPGLSERTFVLSLEWQCKGCVQTENSSLPSSSTVTLAQYQAELVTVWYKEDRMKLLIPGYGLNFHPVLYRDTGQYECLINNRPNSNSAVRLYVQDVPEAPGRPMILGFTSRTVNLSWAVGDSHNSPILYYIISKRVGEVSSWENEENIKTESNKTFYEVKNLLPYTVYSFRITAVNSMGRSRPSMQSYFIITLREVPSGKPVITAAHNTSSTSIHIDWSPPNHNSLHGEFQGYKLLYRPLDKDISFTKELLLHDSKLQSYTLVGLNIFTAYVITLHVFNPEGMGPASTVVVMTDEGVPSKPCNFTLLDVLDSSAKFSWEQPQNPNGIIQGYRLYFLHNGYTDVRTIRNPEMKMKYNLTSLGRKIVWIRFRFHFDAEPSANYKMWLKAFTWKHEGDPSYEINVTTDIRPPQAPIITKLSCEDDNAISIHWKPQSNDTVHFYVIHYRLNTAVDFEELIVNNIAENNQFTIGNLTSGLVYEVKISGARRSSSKNFTFMGPFSEFRRITLQKNCEERYEFHSRLLADFSELGIGVIAGTIFAICAIILVGCGFLLWRMCSHDFFYYNNDKQVAPFLSVSWDMDEDDKKSIPVYLFPAHVSHMHADDDMGFQKEFVSLQLSSNLHELRADTSLQPENKEQNRYTNVVAYDHSRVLLKPTAGRKKYEEYVNANFIDGFQKSRAYIATQGPMPSTFDVFWRMVWEQNVCTIIMITNLLENGRKKCDRYWPENEQCYGYIKVKLLHEIVSATYVIRKLLLRHLKVRKSKCGQRVIFQYHYTNWSDHETPEHPFFISSFIQKASVTNSDAAGPILVHCSAGVGRTGSYIVIDSMLKQMKSQGKLNIYAFLKHIRKQRNFLVQSEEQYVFIHDVLLEMILVGDTSIPSRYFSRYWDSLQSRNPIAPNIEPMKLLENQFNLVTNYVPAQNHFEIALKKNLISKSRSLDFLPAEPYRISLSSLSGSSQSRYINASWMQGYNNLREYIVTQHPLEETVIDFWQMVWEQKANGIVLLSETIDKEYPVFWPTKYLEINSINFKVVLTNELYHSNFIMRMFTLQTYEDDCQLSVSMLQQSDWSDYYKDAKFICESLENIRRSFSYSSNSPLIIIDRFGGTEAVTFCCLSSLIYQLENEDQIDVYMYAKLAHRCRPGVWKRQDDFFYLYRVMESIINHRNQQKDNPKQACDLLANRENIRFLTPVKNGMVRFPPEGRETNYTYREL